MSAGTVRGAVFVFVVVAVRGATGIERREARRGLVRLEPLRDSE